ncbi:GNAT family N-acetyltransferase [Streptomyces sp. NPDC008150]|uniref:GNAT family N-acetyltransferase n=1 Tax=Streptomyces sp. NPDC008150 TaxID=3364816 RepID=UPI0036EAE757
MKVTREGGAAVRSLVPDLSRLLVATVGAGASVGFLAPLTDEDATAWWRERAELAAAGRLAVWTARDGDRILGTIGLVPADKANSRHRAEIVKLMVHPDARGRGVGRLLLSTAERDAARDGVTLLHLDTETDSPAERLYRSCGWTRAGVVPDYAANTDGELRPTTIYYKRLPPPGGDGA